MRNGAWRFSALLSFLVTATSLTSDIKQRGSRFAQGGRLVVRPLFLSDKPIRESFDPQASTVVRPETQPARPSVGRRRKKLQHRRPPAVDSTLLRFVGQQKDKLRAQSTTATADPSFSETNVIADTASQQQQPNNGGGMAVSRTEKKNGVIAPTETGEKGEESALSWWGQYNRHRVETVLLSKDKTLDPAAVAKAGTRVQAQVLARTIRRRIRTFLKERDETWKSDLVSSLTIGSVGEMIAIPGDHSFEDSVDVMMSHGLTAKDITDILQHSPGLVLMRPCCKGAENGECLDHTIDRVFKLLCVTLKLRKYDARKIVRASPGLLTMRGSKSADAMVSLLSSMGVSHTSMARDKAALNVFLLRSPAAMFRLVSFLASDAIRMPVSKIGPLLRRPLSWELLDAIAPISQQTRGASSAAAGSINGNNHTDELSATVEQEVAEVDPWIASALWGRQSQVRRYHTNEMYLNMTRTAWTLRNEIGTADLSKVIAAFPSVLLLDAQKQILPNAEFLMGNLGICEGDLPRVLQLYPTLLGLPIEKMAAVSTFLEGLGIRNNELATVLRSFPALLTLDVEKDMQPVVDFLRSIGVIDVGRFLARIPPILGYSVENELIPKWRHLRSVSSDPRFEVTKFPGYFSYPLERVIKARYEYIQNIKKYPTQLIGVDKVLCYGDIDFAVKVMGDNDEGRAFRKFLTERKTPNGPQKKKKKPRKQPKKGGATATRRTTATTTGRRTNRKASRPSR